MGRPTKYDAGAMITLVEKLAKLGLTAEEMADVFDVGVATFKRWLSEHEPFRAACARGRAIADANVAASLYERAIGYEHDAVKIFCSKDGDVTEVPYRERYAPDAQSAMFWLANRQPKKWRRTPDGEGDAPPLALPTKVVIEIQDGRRVPALVDAAAG